MKRFIIAFVVGLIVAALAAGFVVGVNKAYNKGYKAAIEEAQVIDRHHIKFNKNMYSYDVTYAKRNEGYIAIAQRTGCNRYVLEELNNHKELKEGDEVLLPGSLAEVKELLVSVTEHIKDGSYTLYSDGENIYWDNGNLYGKAIFNYDASGTWGTATVVDGVVVEFK